jgi:transcriptional regulator with XRE-family HTH domain
MNETGQKIMELRTMQNLSQNEFGRLIGVTRQTISKWELGQVEPSAKNLESICEIFDLPITYFFIAKEDLEEKPPQEEAAQTTALTAETKPRAKKKNIGDRIVFIASMTVLISVLLAVFVLSLVIFITESIPDHADAVVRSYSVNGQALLLLVCISLGVLSLVGIALLALLLKKRILQSKAKDKKE